MTEGDNGNHDFDSARLSPNVAISPAPTPSPDLAVRIPKNKSTGNLLAAPTEMTSAEPGRTRFSFDAGSAQEMNSLKRAVRPENEYGLGPSGLRRIRRPAGPLKTPTFLSEGQEWIPPSLIHANTLPISSATSRSVSAGYLMSGPSSPVLEDLHRFPAESLHSFSFAKQSEDSLRSRQNILQKSVDFMRDRSTWASNPALAEAQARVSGDVDIQSMMELLKKANILPNDKKDKNVKGLALGPMTGPAFSDGRNIFEKSFSQQADAHEEAIFSPEVLSPLLPAPEEPLRRSSAQSIQSPDLEIRRPSSSQSIAAPRKLGLKRTYTDLSSLTLQQKLMEALAQPYSADESTGTPGKPPPPPALTPTSLAAASTAVHSHSSKWSPPAQAVFRTDADAPWTILSANDIACLVFGVTGAEVRSLSILGVIEEHRRPWLEEKLGRPQLAEEVLTKTNQSNGAKLLASGKGGITARLLSKAPSRTSKSAKRSQTDDGSGGYYRQKNHPPTKSRGVLLCGDIVPIQKRNGMIGSASFWVMEKKGGLIWVIEEIIEDNAQLLLDDQHLVKGTKGQCEAIWGSTIAEDTPLGTLVPRLTKDFIEQDVPPRQPLTGYFTTRTFGGVNIPATLIRNPGSNELRVSSLPHIAGMMVLNPENLTITSSNSVFSAALFGYEQPGGLPMCTLIPMFADVLNVLKEDEDVDFVDGLVVPEHSFRRARAILALREGSETVASIFLRPSGLPAKHRDGSDIMVDLQMRIVRSETVFPAPKGMIEEKDEDAAETAVAVAELVYAVWITYSRQLHAAGSGLPEREPSPSARPFTPPSQPQPPENLPSPPPASAADSGKSNDSSQLSLLSPQMSIDEPLEHPPPHTPYVPHEKKTINDFVILEDLGTGAYGQVKLGRYNKSKAKVVLKYVTKKRILVDTWTRDRRLGTVPLEIHVMDYLRRDGLRHPNIVEMIDFFEDNINYYIETYPIGMPGMDLFDYIELRANMEEAECKSIFRQVVDAIHHLHTKAFVVHRDVKDENVVLDGEGRIKLIDFGSAAYIKNGPFDVFVGTIDYAAPEVLQGKPYGGKEQDVWALGILLYTIVYKENPFYNIDEILDHPLRVPYIPFTEMCIDLIRKMLDRDVEQRVTIEEVKDHPWLVED